MPVALPVAATVAAHVAAHVAAPLARHAGTLGSIPSPSSGQLHLGPLALNAYGLCIAAGVVAAVWLSARRWRDLGGDPDHIARIAYIAVPAGVLGARLYHLATDWKSYRGRWTDALRIWEGGLGVWGGVALGVLVGIWVARRLGLPIPTMLDVVAPAIPLAQAIGRWGNWFNGELFGGPTDLPWGLEIPVANRPAAFQTSQTFHPTFLYESVWNLGICLVIVALTARLRRSFRPGASFALYTALYTLGRFFIERMRVDPASLVLGLRINEWTSLVVFVISVAVLVRLRRRSGDEATGDGEQASSSPAHLG